MHRCYSIASLASLCLLPVSVLAEDFTVPGDFDTIQEAINATDDSDTIIATPALTSTEQLPISIEWAKAELPRVEAVRSIGP